MKKHFYHMVAIAAGMALAGCGQDSPVGVPVSQLRRDMEDVGGGSGGDKNDLASFVEIERGQEGPWLKESAALFSSEAEWQTTMAKWAEEGKLAVSPGPGAPEGINWNTEAVILVSAGELPTGPAEIKIEAIRRQGKAATVEVKLQAPGSMNYFTSPYHLVKIERKGLETIEVKYILG